MNTARIEKLIIKNTKGLPTEALLEILDFVQFIRGRKKSFDNLNNELSLLNETEISHLEEEFKNYKELYPRED